eukprot:scaffold5662_cov132-Skeletonema_menzelii.AAC.3
MKRVDLRVLMNSYSISMHCNVWVDLWEMREEIEACRLKKKDRAATMIAVVSKNHCLHLPYHT